MTTEVFQASFQLERRLLHDTVKAVLGAILFQRVLGNCAPSSNEVCSVTLPAPGGPEMDALISEKTDEVSRARLEGSIKLVLALYPTPLAPSAPKKAVTRPNAPSGWFSSIAAFNATDPAGGNEHDREVYGKPWEGWIIDFEIIVEQRNRSVGEEKLRSQLNHFLLKLLAFNEKTTNSIPPIISGALVPFGVEILINPTRLPFSIPSTPNPTAEATYPLLFKTLVTPKEGLAPVRGYSR